MGNLAFNHAANKVAIVAAGAVPPLVALLRSGSEPGKERSAGALLILAVNAENQVKIAAAGAIDPLLALQRNGSAEAQAISAGALTELAKTAENQETIAAARAAAGGVEA